MPLSAPIKSKAFPTHAGHHSGSASDAAQSLGQFYKMSSVLAGFLAPSALKVGCLAVRGVTHVLLSSVVDLTIARQIRFTRLGMCFPQNAVFTLWTVKIFILSSLLCVA